MQRAILATVLMLLASVPASGRMAMLDRSFGSDGTTVLRLGSFVAHCYDVARQSDGALVLAGGSGFEPPESFYEEYDATLVRLQPDGRPDPAFGENGVVVRRTGRRPFEDVFLAVRIMSDGRIVAVGHEIEGDVGRALVARFDPDGHPDASFGDGGRVTLDIGHVAQASGVVVRDDGRIVLVATIWVPGAVPGGFPGTDFHTDLALVGLQADGTPDAVVGGTGVRIIDDAALEYALGLIPQSDGSVVVGASVFDADRLDYDVALSRYSPDGARDDSYGTSGRTVVDLGFLDYGAKLTPLPGDRLLVVSGSPGIQMARFDADGHADPTFGTDGVARSGGELRIARAVAPVARDQLLVAALDLNLEGNPFVPRLLRFRSDGGVLGSDVQLPIDIEHLLVEPDGRIVTATLDAGSVWIASRLEPPWGAWGRSKPVGALGTVQSPEEAGRRGRRASRAP
jgi:uncharacterized delta-60 repeat protein